MTTQLWSCQDTASNMEFYRLGQLEPARAERLFDHALACEDCYRGHWQPFQEESEFLMGLFLESIDPEAGEDHESGPTTVDGASTITSLAAWTSSEDLPLSPMLKSDALRQKLEPRAAVSTLTGPRLRQVGTLLPRVPRRTLLGGYCLYLGHGLPRPDQTPLTTACLVVEADGDDDRVYLEALSSGVHADSIPVGTTERRELRWSHLIEVNGATYLFQAESESGKKRLGAGLLRHSGETWAVPDTGFTIGRGEGLDLRLPDRETQANLRFHPDALKAIVDPEKRERASKLTLDALEVSRHHAVLSRNQAGRLELRAEGKFPVRVSGDTHWTSTEQGQPALPVHHGDTLLVGQALLEYRER